jgi:hypothetical protein
MMEVASTSDTPVNFYQIAWRSIPEDSHLHGFRLEITFRTFVKKLYGA